MREQPFFCSFWRLRGFPRLGGDWQNFHFRAAPDANAPNVQKPRRNRDILKQKECRKRPAAPPPPPLAATCLVPQFLRLDCVEVVVGGGASKANTRGVTRTTNLLLGRRASLSKPLMFMRPPESTRRWHSWQRVGLIILRS